MILWRWFTLSFVHGSSSNSTLCIYQCTLCHRLSYHWKKKNANKLRHALRMQWHEQMNSRMRYVDCLYLWHCARTAAFWWNNKLLSLEIVCHLHMKSKMSFKMKFNSALSVQFSWREVIVAQWASSSPGRNRQLTYYVYFMYMLCVYRVFEDFYVFSNNILCISATFNQKNLVNTA